MAIRPNHICRICGLQYYACDSCDQKIGIFWRGITCSLRHSEVYKTLIAFRDGQINKEEAAKLMREIGLTQGEINTFVPNIKEKINNIFNSTDLVPVRRPRKKIVLEDEI